MVRWLAKDRQITDARAVLNSAFAKLPDAEHALKVVVESIIRQIDEMRLKGLKLAFDKDSL
jgi:hypothetical protein